MMEYQNYVQDKESSNPAYLFLQTIYYYFTLTYITNYKAPNTFMCIPLTSFLIANSGCLHHYILAFISSSSPVLQEESRFYLTEVKYEVYIDKSNTLAIPERKTLF